MTEREPILFVISTPSLSVISSSEVTRNLSLRTSSGEKSEYPVILMVKRFLATLEITTLLVFVQTLLKTSGNE